MKNRRSELPKGEKKRCIQEAIESLGLEAGFSEASKWIKDKYGIEVSDPAFYHTRQDMRKEAGHQANEPSQAKSFTPKAEKKATSNGIAAVVTRAKALVEELGKEEAKKLIDAL